MDTICCWYFVGCTLITRLQRLLPLSWLFGCSMAISQIHIFYFTLILDTLLNTFCKYLSQKIISSIFIQLLEIHAWNMMVKIWGSQNTCMRIMQDTWVKKLKTFNCVGGEESTESEMGTRAIWWVLWFEFENPNIFFLSIHAPVLKINWRRMMLIINQWIKYYTEYLSINQLFKQLVLVEYWTMCFRI